MTPREFIDRIAALNELAAPTVNSSTRAQLFASALLGLLDGAKARYGAGHSCSEEEWISFCRLVYRKVRTPSPGAS